MDGLVDGVTSSAKPIELSFPFPRSLHKSVNVHLTCLTSAILLFLTTTSTGEASGSSAPMGSFVYAMPSRSDPPSQPLSTPLYTREGSLDFTTRLAKILARRSGKPTYVGNSMVLTDGMGAGPTVEEEMEGLGKIVDVVMGEVERCSGGG